MPADPRRVKDLFGAAAALADPVERSALLDRECGGNAELRQRLDALLRAHDNPESALERPLAGPDADGDRTAEHRAIAGVGTVVAGRYKLLEAIGEGGMGEVWVADQLEPIRRRVALKLIKPGMDSRSVLGRFEAERQALAVMDHPNIAKVLDAGTADDGRPYFVMELVKGTPITEFCDARKLTPKQRLELFVPVCQAIQHAHMKGIIHRDIKPSNVLVALHDELPVPKVIDFGVAKAVGQQLTEKTVYTGFGALVGTPAYMAPEQATFNQLDIDTRADVYALGVLLYELLAGSPPIEAERMKKAALDEVLRLVRDEEPPRPSQRLSTSQAKATIAATRQSDPGKLSQLMKGELDWIVMKALEKDRTRRYETANGFAADVQRYLSGEPVQAVPPSIVYRVRKAYRRNRPAVLAAAAFVGLLAASVVTATVLAVQARTAERAAVAERVRAEEGEAEAKDQRDRAERERKRAEEEKRASEAVRTFLQDDLLRQADIFTQADSMPQAGGEFEIKPNPTVRDLLDRAAAQLTPERIEKKFPGMPFVQAEVLHAVANAYGGVGESERGRPLIDRAVPLYRAVRGDTDPVTLKARKSQLKFGFALPQEEKEALMASYVEDATRVFGPRDREVLEARMVHACTSFGRNRAAEAIPTLKKLRTELTDSFGATDILTLTCGAALAQAYMIDKQFALAVREMEGLRDTIKGMTVRFDHPMLDEGYVLLAEAYRMKGDIEKTIEVYEEVLDGWKQRGQPYRGNTWRVRHLLAWVYARNGNPAKGAELFEANVAAAPSTFNAYLSLDALREAEVKLGRDDKALVGRARQALAAAIGNRGTNYKSWVTGHARIRLGQQLLKTKEYAEAEAMLIAGEREMLAEYPHIRDYSLNAIPEGQKSLIELYWTTNRQPEGVKVLAEIWAAFEKTGAKALTAAIQMRHRLGWLIIDEHPSSAALLFEHNVRAATEAEVRCKALYGLHRAELKLGKLDAALDRARQALDTVVKANGPDHRDFLTGQMRAAIGLVLVRQKKLAEAEPFLTAGCREIADHLPQATDDEYPSVSDAFEVLVRLYRDTNRPDREKEWLAFKGKTFDTLIRKNLTGGKLTPSGVKLVQALVMNHIDAGRHDGALALFRELNDQHPPADKPATDAWLRLSDSVLDGYQGRLQTDRMKPWAELRIPPLERELEAVRKSKPTEVSLLRATNTLAYSYLHAGRHADVVKLAEEVLARQKTNGWELEPGKGASFSDTVEAVALAGRPELAVEIGSSALAELKKLNPSPEVLATAIFWLGFARSHARDHAGAEGLFREAVRLQIQADAKHWKLAKCKAWLGFALHDQKSTRPPSRC